MFVLDYMSFRPYTLFSVETANSIKKHIFCNNTFVIVDGFFLRRL